MDVTKNIEDYLKAIFYIINESKNGKAGTNQLADYLNLSPASVSSMLRKLKEKKMVAYEKYGKLELTQNGHEIAVQLVRKHRLWETFLCEQLKFSWDEVHEVAHQLEHIHSPKLIIELDKFLGHPKFDPHGDVIPDEKGNFKFRSKITLSELKKGDLCRLISVKDSSAVFLKYVTQIGLALSSEIEIKELREFDNSMLILFNEKTENISNKFAENIYVEKVRINSK